VDSSCSNLAFGVGEPEVIHPSERVSSQGWWGSQHLNSWNGAHSARCKKMQVRSSPSGDLNYITRKPVYAGKQGDAGCAHLL